MALERRRQLIDDALPHPSHDVRAGLRHEGGQQEAAERPGQAAAARREGRRCQVERAIDLALLGRIRTLASISSEESLAGKEVGSTGSYRWSWYHKIKQTPLK